MRHVPMGITEFAVEIHMKRKLKSKLSFKAPWDGIIYGCARSKKDLEQKLGLKSEIKTAKFRQEQAPALRHMISSNDAHINPNLHRRIYNRFIFADKIVLTRFYRYQPAVVVHYFAYGTIGKPHTFIYILDFSALPFALNGTQ